MFELRLKDEEEFVKRREGKKSILVRGNRYKGPEEGITCTKALMRERGQSL